MTAPQCNYGTVKQCDLIFKHFSLGNYHFPKARWNSASLFIQDSGNGTLKSQLSGFKRGLPFMLVCDLFVGIVAGGSRIDKPLLKAGRVYHKYKAKKNCWPKVWCRHERMCPLLLE